MGIEAWYVLGVIVVVIIALMTNRISVDVVMVGGLTLMLLGDAIPGFEIIPVNEAIKGFAHEAIMMIGALYVVAGGLQATGGMEAIAQKLLGRPKTVIGAQLRLMIPVSIMSGFTNNTPIVAMYLPIVGDWARKLRISPSKLFMPLSYAAIMGGKITLIGTASNIVLMGLYMEYMDDQAMSSWATALGVEAPSAAKQFWGVALVGLPTTILGFGIIVLTSKWLLPARRSAGSQGSKGRRYEVQMMIEPDSPIVGKTIEEAGLRHLPGLFLVHIERAGDTLYAVAPETRLQANDLLSFAGILESVVDLRKIRGLVPATDQVKKVAADQKHRTLVEAVIASESPLVGKTVRESNFRTTFNAAIVAVRRNGERINKKIGDITLKVGDTLLLDTHDGFLTAHRDSNDFYLVSGVEGSRPIRHERAWMALVIFGILIALLTLTSIPKVVAAFFCAMLMIGTRCITGTEARDAIGWQVLLVIGAALGMGAALRETGAAETIAHGLIDMANQFGAGPWIMLLVMFVLTTAFAQFITSYGAAVLMFPIAMQSAQDLGVSPEPFIFSLMIAAGSIFISPVGYQTNLMVYGPGGYRFTDFVRLGTPLTIVVAIGATVVAPLVFPFLPAAP